MAGGLLNKRFAAAFFGGAFKSERILGAIDKFGFGNRGDVFSF